MSSLVINNKLLKKEKVLYNDAVGTSGTVTLDGITTDYRYIEIFARDTNSEIISQKIYNPFGKKIQFVDCELA